MTFRLKAIMVVVAGLLFACGDGKDSGSVGEGGGAGGGAAENGGGGPSKNANAWAGSWAGTVNCEGFYEDSDGRQPFQGPVPIEAEFDPNGHMLLPVNGAPTPQTHQGQHDKWVPGKGVSQRLLSRFDDRGEQRYYLFKESFEETDAHGSFTQTVDEEYDLRVEGDTMRGSYNMLKTSRTYFTSEYGSGTSESQEQAACQGELKRK